MIRRWLQASLGVHRQQPMAGLPFDYGEHYRFQKPLEQNGGPNTIVLEVSGRGGFPPPDSLQFRYQQCKRVPTEDDPFEAKSWSPLIYANCSQFTIRNLDPVGGVAGRGSLYVQVRVWKEKQWRNWSGVARIQKWTVGAPDVAAPSVAVPAPVPTMLTPAPIIVASSLPASTADASSSGDAPPPEPVPLEEQSSGSSAKGKKTVTSAPSLVRVASAKEEVVISKLQELKKQAKESSGELEEEVHGWKIKCSYDSVKVKHRVAITAANGWPNFLWERGGPGTTSCEVPVELRGIQNEAALKRAMGLLADDGSGKRSKQDVDDEVQATKRQKIEQQQQDAPAAYGGVGDKAEQQSEVFSPTVYRSTSQPAAPESLPAATLPAAPAPGLPPQHVALPKPRQPTKHSAGENYIKVRIELEPDVPVLGSYEFEVEYKQDGDHATSNKHKNNLSPVFSANALTDGQKYRFRVRVLKGEMQGPFSSWSHALLCKKGRDPIETGLKRKMWADFYTAPGEHEDETGSRLDQPCLGCSARGRRVTMLSPLLTNVDASHVIAESLGGPKGDQVEASWNFMPLCADCNRNQQGVKNLIDWLLEEGQKSKPANLLPLYEVLIRLRRACVKNHLVDSSSKAPRSNTSARRCALTAALRVAENLVDFACEVYQEGLPSLLPANGVGAPHTFDSGMLGTDHGQPGGFATTKSELMTALYDNFYSRGMAEAQMLQRVEEMDGQAQLLQKLSRKLQMKLNACSDNTQVQALVNRVGPILDRVGGEIDEL